MDQQDAIGLHLIHGFLNQIGAGIRSLGVQDVGQPGDIESSGYRIAEEIPTGEVDSVS